MSNRKSFKVSEEEYKLLQRSKSISTEDKQKQREITIRKYAVKIKQFGRMKKDKEIQVENKNYTEKSDTFVNGKKPEFLLLNEIDELEEQIVDLSDADKALKEEYETSKEKKE